MAEHFPCLQQKHIDFIGRQKIFFVATAGAEGYINLSPKGMDSLRVVDAATVIWLNVTGSGNESAAHVKENGRMTVMFCSFEEQPLILRLYGTARAIHPRDPEWSDLLGRFPAHPGARQVFRLSLSKVQTSCGYAVPYYDYEGERPTLNKWAVNKGGDGILQYWIDKNRVSLDGRDTGLFEDN